MLRHSDMSPSVALQPEIPQLFYHIYLIWGREIKFSNTKKYFEYLRIQHNFKYSPITPTIARGTGYEMTL